MSILVALSTLQVASAAPGEASFGTGFFGLGVMVAGDVSPDDPKPGVAPFVRAHAMARIGRRSPVVHGVRAETATGAQGFFRLRGAYLVGVSPVSNDEAQLAIYTSIGAAGQTGTGDQIDAVAVLWPGIHAALTLRAGSSVALHARGGWVSAVYLNLVGLDELRFTDGPVAGFGPEARVGATFGRPDDANRLFGLKIEAGYQRELYSDLWTVGVGYGW